MLPRPVEESSERGKSSPGSRLRTSTESLRGEMLSAATIHSALRPRLYSTRKAVIGDPPLALGIQVTYTELSVAMEMVGRSGASGTVSTKKNNFSALYKLRVVPPVITASQHKKDENKENSESDCSWSYVYLLPGLLAIKLEKAGEGEREKSVSEKSSVSFSKVGLLVTQIQSQSFLLTAFFIQTVTTRCQLVFHCLYFKGERSKAEHV